MGRKITTKNKNSVIMFEIAMNGPEVVGAWVAFDHVWSGLGCHLPAWSLGSVPIGFDLSGT
jgi:hypothetical protein